MAIRQSIPENLLYSDAELRLVERYKRVLTVEDPNKLMEGNEDYFYVVRWDGKTPSPSGEYFSDTGPKLHDNYRAVIASHAFFCMARQSIFEIVKMDCFSRKSAPSQ